MKIWSALWIVFLFALPISAHASPLIDLDQVDEKVNIHSNMEIMEDEAGSWTVREIADGEAENEFTVSERGAPSFGYSESVYWVRFTVDPSSVEDVWYLKLDNPAMDEVELYEESSGSLIRRAAGDLYPYAMRDMNNRMFVFKMDYVDAEEPIDYVMRFESAGAMQLPLTLYDQSAYSDSTQLDYLIMGLLVGLAAVMAIYNLFIYFSTRSGSYLYYVLFIIVNLITFLSFTGLAYQFLWPEAVWWNNRSIIFFMILSNMMALLFARSFLELKKRLPRAEKYFYGAIIVNGAILIIWYFSYSLALNLTVLAAVSTIVFVITIGFAAYRQGFRPAVYFLVAWQFFVFGVLISVFTDLGIVPYTFFTKYAWQILTSVELVLFSFALADKINMIRLEKEEAKQEALDTLRKTDELKTEFLTVTSHELRTPLHGMIGLAESLKEEVAGPVNKEMHRNLDMIIKSGRRLSLLISDITDFSRLEKKDLSIDTEEVDLAEAIDIVVQMTSEMTEERELTIVNEAKELPLVLADEQRIQQVLFNLLYNAIKYTPSGEVRISAERGKETVTIFISDTGIGIPEEEIETVFNPFQRGKNASAAYKEGVGIGLNLAKKMIEHQGGELRLQSKIGKGSTFSFSLPLSGKSIPVKAEEEKGVILSEPKHRPGRKRILLADDEPVNVQVIMNFLELDGYEVTPVMNGKDILTAVKRKTFDLVILDMMMPELSGYNTCKILRKKYSMTELPILMLTAQNKVEDRIASYEAGANDYLVKPADRKELLIRVKTHLQHAEAVSELEKRKADLEKMNMVLEERVEIRTQELEAANQDLQCKNAQLKDMEASRQQMLSNISHELGTPITFLQNYVQTVREGYIAADDEVYLTLVQKKVKMLERLINDLYELVKLESGTLNVQLEPVDFHSWITELHESYSLEAAQEGWDFPDPVINMGPDDQKIIVEVDKERMNQVFQNILSNAVKHAESGGEIFMKAELRENTESDSGGEVVIHITDNGLGIDREQLNNIFERFYRAPKEGGQKEGSGLGLAITRGIITRHGGEIWAESEIGKGTTISFSLPVRLIKAAASGRGNIYEKK
ncbi:ATP-binding protein [Alkalicoccus halolimnae]|uniref:histidine kinase n=1 Tax=Alkalicoccus halolimnae TaxID=1667239 RepID=A0AAJ8LT84_9BACI|nr:ATP-binding protein [Alkalicoccus halolimnae]